MDHLPIRKYVITLKKVNVVWLLMMALLLQSSYYNFAWAHDLEIKYEVKGVYHDLNDGLTKHEFNVLTMSTNHDVEVLSFTIIHSRGNRAVESIDVKGNKFNLRKFVPNARAGDYIVITIKKLSENSHPKCARFKAIKVY